jgi:hypothetical protein
VPVSDPAVCDPMDVVDVEGPVMVNVLKSSLI